MAAIVPFAQGTLSQAYFELMGKQTSCVRDRDACAPSLIFAEH